LVIYFILASSKKNIHRKIQCENIDGMVNAKISIPYTRFYYAQVAQECILYICDKTQFSYHMQIIPVSNPKVYLIISSKHSY